MLKPTEPPRHPRTHSQAHAAAEFRASWPGGQFLAALLAGSHSSPRGPPQHSRACPRSGQRASANQMGAAVLCNITRGVTSCHLCCTASAGSRSRSPHLRRRDDTGCEQQKARIANGVRVCLPALLRGRDGVSHLGVFQELLGILRPTRPGVQGILFAVGKSKPSSAHLC